MSDSRISVYSRSEARISVLEITRRICETPQLDNTVEEKRCKLITQLEWNSMYFNLLILPSFTPCLSLVACNHRSTYILSSLPFLIFTTKDPLALPTWSLVGSSQHHIIIDIFIVAVKYQISRSVRCVQVLHFSKAFLADIHLLAFRSPSSQSETHIQPDYQANNITDQSIKEP